MRSLSLCGLLSTTLFSNSGHIYTFEISATEFSGAIFISVSYALRLSSSFLTERGTNYVKRLEFPLGLFTVAAIGSPPSSGFYYSMAYII